MHLRKLIRNKNNLYVQKWLCYFLINDNNTHFVRIIFSSFTNQVLRGAEINFNIQTRNLFFQKSEFVDIIRTNPVLSCPMWNCDVIIIHFISNNLKYMYSVWSQRLEDLGNVIEADRYIHAYVYNCWQYMWHIIVYIVFVHFTCRCDISLLWSTTYTNFFIFSLSMVNLVLSQI